MMQETRYPGYIEHNGIEIQPDALIKATHPHTAFVFHCADCNKHQVVYDVRVPMLEQDAIAYLIRIFKWGYIDNYYFCSTCERVHRT